MSTLINFNSLLKNKAGMGYALIRMFLGVALAIRGGMILAYPDEIIEIGVTSEYFIWVSLVGVIHLVGGVFMCIGFFTRLSALAQIPILFSAVFFIYDYTKLMMGGQSLELATLVLFLLVIFFIFGPGMYSINSYGGNKKY